MYSGYTKLLKILCDPAMLQHTIETLASLREPFMTGIWIFLGK